MPLLGCELHTSSLVPNVILNKARAKKRNLDSKRISDRIDDFPLRLRARVR